MKVLCIEGATFLALRRYLIDTGGKGTEHVCVLDDAAADGVHFVRKLKEVESTCAGITITLNQIITPV